MGLRGLGPREINGKDHGGSCGGGRCRVCEAAGDVWVRLTGGSGEEYVGQMGGFSHESEHDLALMVSDFMENGSSGADSRWCSSDSDSGILDLGHLADKISLHKQPVDQRESDLHAIVHVLLLSMNEWDLYGMTDGQCNGSCIRRSLVKRLRASGYDASICTSKWHGSDRVPGGDHEYIDVRVQKGTEEMECLIVDIDFRSHFEIARAVESYDAILRSLPVIYVGSWNRLKLLLQVMVDAARSSLKQNSMPLPPWRSLAYLQSKWDSTSVRTLKRSKDDTPPGHFAHHKQCVGHLKMLRSALQSEMEIERLLKPVNIDKSWKVKPDRRKMTFLKA